MNGTFDKHGLKDHVDRILRHLIEDRGRKPKVSHRFALSPGFSPRVDGRYPITLEDLQSTDPESFLENIRLLARAAHEQHAKISSDTPFLLFEDIFSLFPLG